MKVGGKFLIGVWTLLVVANIINGFATVEDTLWISPILIAGIILWIWAVIREKKIAEEIWIAQNKDSHTSNALTEDQKKEAAGVILKQHQKKLVRTWTVIIIALAAFIITAFVFRPKPYVNPHYPNETSP